MRNCGVANMEGLQMKRQDEKRVTLALDGPTYVKLRLYGVETDQSNQDILDKALREFLARQEAG